MGLVSSGVVLVASAGMYRLWAEFGWVGLATVVAFGLISYVVGVVLEPLWIRIAGL